MGVNKSRRKTTAGILMMLIILICTIISGCTSVNQQKTETSQVNTYYSTPLLTDDQIARITDKLGNDDENIRTRWSTENVRSGCDNECGTKYLKGASNAAAAEAAAQSHIQCINNCVSRVTQFKPTTRPTSKPDPSCTWVAGPVGSMYCHHAGEY